ncbi:MAG: hypothetical protein KGH69_00105 [Candidatus Micrarchaeota archaeon]|nr:hypothetical protein [Candidatus Micrarchaeota archaeon]
MAQEKELRIIVDNRERDLSIIEGLSSNGVDITFAQLPVGDYIVSDRICIERKTVGDFENSIIDNRLFEQVSRLNESFTKPMLLIEGEDDFRLGNNVIVGTMLRLYTDYNLQMLRSDSKEQTVSILSKVAEREQVQENREPRLLGLKKAYSTDQWQLLILGSMPGVGPKLARNLISHFKSIRNVVNASAEELQEVDKIGKKKAIRINEILDSEFGSGETAT